MSPKKEMLALLAFAAMGFAQEDQFDAEGNPIADGGAVGLLDLPQDYQDAFDAEGNPIADDGSAVDLLEFQRPAAEGVELAQTISPLDDLCQGAVNVAPLATPTSSGGGSTIFGVANLNDESPNCMMHWLFEFVASPFVQYDWAAAQTIESFVIGTDAFCGVAASCQQAVGRGVGEGAVEYWDGAAWISAGSFTNSGERITFAFPQAITTTSLRVLDIASHSCGSGNPVIYEWAVCEAPPAPVAPLDNLCGTNVNVAPLATPTSSGGGATIFGTQNLNDESPYCLMHWLSDFTASPFIQYDWSTAQTIESFVIGTDAFCGLTGGCQQAVGRGVGEGSVEYWDGVAWISAGSFTNSGERIIFAFPQVVTTTALRVFDIASHNCGSGNPVIYEWAVCEGAPTPAPIVAPLDDLCPSNLVNVAPLATPTSSGGGSTIFGVANLNDESPNCMMHWLYDFVASPFIQYDWAAAQTIESFVIGTDAFCGVAASCQQAVGRGVGEGSVEYWDGAAWISAGSFTNSGERITFAFPQAITTTSLRVTDIASHSCGSGNPVIYEWAVCQ